MILYIYFAFNRIYAIDDGSADNKKKKKNRKVEFQMFREIKKLTQV